MPTTDRGPAGRVRVWGRVVRALHWLLVAGVAAAWLTRHGFGLTHEVLGYATLAVVVLRVAWGFGPARHARFDRFLKPPAVTMDYARRCFSARPPRHLGHNPLGGWMAVLLLGLVLAVCASGWLYTTDRFWGIEWVENLHDGLTSCLLLLVAVHIAGAVWTSAVQRDNLVAAMIHGHKRALRPGEGVDD